MNDRDDIVIIRKRDGRSTQSSDSAGKGLLVLLGVLALLGMGRQTSEAERKSVQAPAECRGDCIAAFGAFLAATGGRAFVMGTNGTWSWRSDQADDRTALGQALQACVMAGGIDCHGVALGDRRLDDDANLQ